MHRHRSGRAAAGITVALLVVAGGAAGGGGIRSAKATTALRFGTATVVDPTNVFGEPDLRLDGANPNQWYSSGPWGTGVQRSIWERSTDGAHTFREMHDHPDPAHTGGSLLPPGGGDTEIATDHTGKLYMADLAALQTQKAYTSTDGGKTFANQVLPPVFHDNNGTDRQWISVWDPPDPSKVQSAYKGPFPVAYMTFLAAGLGGTITGETVATSVPNGSDSSRVGLDYACAPGAQGAALCPHWQLGGDGFTAVDQLTGKVVQAIETTDAHVGIEVETPGANGYMASVAKVNVATEPANNSSSAIFPVATMDAKRNVYVVWIERPGSDADFVNGKSWQVFYAWAPPGPGSTWSNFSAPIRISKPPSVTAVMPWAVAGGNGGLDVAWYASTSKLTTVSNESIPAIAAASWTLTFAQVLQANTATPQVTQVEPTGTPMHDGSICLDGLNCIMETGNRNLADFFEVTTDANGAAAIVFNDTSNNLIQQVPVVEVGVPQGVVDHRGAEVVMVVRQIGGTTLSGGQVNVPDDHGVNGITSPQGDALYDPITGAEQTGLDITGTSLTLNGDHLEAAIQVVDPASAGTDLLTNGLPFGDFVVRWAFKSTLYFAEVEITPAGTVAPVFLDGQVQSIDLCSVSACDPHVTVYPGPTVAPLTSHVVTGRIAPASGGKPGAIVIDVPLADVGSPAKGDRLDSVGAYSLVSSSSALLPLSNLQAQTDIVPIEVDGACCFTPFLGEQAPNPVVVPSPTPTPPSGATPTPTPTLGGGGNPNTSGAAASRGATVLAAVAVGIGALLLRRRRRPRA